MIGRPAPSIARTWIAALAVAVGLGVSIPAPAVAQESLESPIKATFLYRFGDFVEWPPGAFPAVGAPLNICVVGVDVFGEVLDAALAGQSAAGRALAIHRLTVLDAGSNCHIAYISGSGAQPVEMALEAVRNAPVLTVTDAANGDTRGAVHFEVVDDKVRFHIDEAAASRGGLAVSSRLLNIALTVQRRAP